MNCFVGAVSVCCTTWCGLKRPLSELAEKSSTYCFMPVSYGSKTAQNSAESMHAHLCSL